MAPSFGWWAKKKHRGTPVIVKMENPNWSMVELEGPLEENYLLGGGSGGNCDKVRGKNAKQLTLVLLLRAHRAAGCLTSIAAAMFGLAAAVRRRLASGRTDSDNGSENENPRVRRRIYACIRAFLWSSLVLLGFEIAASFTIFCNKL